LFPDHIFRNRSAGYGSGGRVDIGTRTAGEFLTTPNSFRMPCVTHPKIGKEKTSSLCCTRKSWVKLPGLRRSWRSTSGNSTIPVRAERRTRPNVVGDALPLPTAPITDTRFEENLNSTSFFGRCTADENETGTHVAHKSWVFAASTRNGKAGGSREMIRGR